MVGHLLDIQKQSSGVDPPLQQQMLASPDHADLVTLNDKEETDKNAI